MEFPSKEIGIALTFENQRKIGMNKRYIHISIIYKGKLHILQSDVCSYEFCINEFSQSQIGNICEGEKRCSDMDIPTPLLPKQYCIASSMDDMYCTKYY